MLVLLIKNWKEQKIHQVFFIKNREELPKLYLKGDVLFLADFFENFIIVSNKELISILCILYTYLAVLGSAE